jgi:type I restriction enzyme S subunit
MKDSGIEWIGEIPAEWEIGKVGYFYDIQLGKMLQSNRGSSDDTFECYLCAANVGKNKLTLDKLKQMYFSPSEKASLELKKGDLIVVEGGDVASCDVIQQNISSIYFQNSLHRVRSKKDGIDVRILKYFLQTAKSMGYVDLACNKATIAHFSKEKFASMPMVVIPLGEQRAIADFLDHQCASIDAVLEKTRASIKEYRQLKQSVITQAVTKGVRGDRPMKASGIEWLPLIPEGWVPRRGKTLFAETNERSESGEEELLTVSHITGITPRRLKNVNMFMSESLVGYKLCHEGDLAANTMWMWQGAIGVSKYEGVISPSYNTYRQIADAYDLGFLEYLLRIPPLVAVYSAYSTGITESRLRLYPEQFLSIMFPVPPKAEQVEIADYLDTTVREIDLLIEKKSRLIEELERYKQSLVYEYVTGKQEVPA